MGIIKIIIETSARHAHLFQKDLEKLFGVGHELKVKNWLSQKGQFAAEETVTIKTKEAEVKNVRILGPTREKTQVEISRTDACRLKIDPPIRYSGELKNTPGITIIGPQGKVKIKEGVIIAARHLHADPKEAKQLGLKDGQMVSVRVRGKRGLIFNNVKIRVKPDFVWKMHIDTDEANAADIRGEGEGEVLVKGQKVENWWNWFVE